MEEQQCLSGDYRLTAARRLSCKLTQQPGRDDLDLSNMIVTLASDVGLSFRSDYPFLA